MFLGLGDLGMLNVNSLEAIALSVLPKTYREEQPPSGRQTVYHVSSMDSLIVSSGISLTVMSQVLRG